jgi:hypothetical protein
VRGSIAALAMLVATPFAGAVPAAARPTFVENVGQFPPEALFVSQGPSAAIYLTRGGPVIDLFGRGEDEARAAGQDAPPMRSRDRRLAYPSARYALALRFAGGSAAARLEGLAPSPGAPRYAGARGGQARVLEPRAFERVAYREAWPGIDVVYGIDADGALTYEIVAGPGADPARAAIAYEGATAEIERGPTRILRTPLGEVHDARPASGGSVGRLTFTAHRAAADGAVEAGAAGAAGLHWSTLLGGSLDEEIHAVALDTEGRPVVTGIVRSADFPVTIGALDPSWNGNFDAFVAKLSADGSTLLWSTYLGASGDDRGWAIRLDAQDRPVVAGVTTSDLFPTTVGAYDTTRNGGFDAFVTQLSADGASLVWSTFLGGSDWEFDVSGLALDAAGRPVVVGSTESADFPTTLGAWDTALGGTQDAFAAKLSADGSALVWSSYLGGSGLDIGEDVGLTADDRPVLVGRTYSADFPATPGAFQTALASTGATQDAFVARLAADGSAVEAATYVGGAANDEGYGIAVEGDAATVFTGYTVSTDFPTTPGSLYPAYRGGGDAFVTRLAPDLTALGWSTYLGGTAGDRGLDLASEGAGGRATVVGWTCAANFPTTATAYDATYNGPCDAYAARLAADGGSLSYATFLGGYTDEMARAVVADPLGRLVVGGSTLSPDYPTTPGALGTTHASPETWADAFLTWVAPPGFCTTVDADGSLALAKAGDLGCPPGPPAPEAIDVIEGRLEALSATDIGEVWPIACDALATALASGTVPPAGLGYFQLARFASGSYADGGGPGLVGSRTPLSGDCP